MRKAGVLVALVLLLLFGTLFIRRRRRQGLGRVDRKLRPPKIRIVYSRKIKASERPQVTSAQEVVRILRAAWSAQIEIREEFMVLHLDQSNRVLGYQLLSKGGIAGTVADIRLIYAAALKSLAVAIIIAHNHPSGNLNPSQSDRILTRRIKEAGEVLDIRLLDHIILTKETYYSFADNGDL
ncbi:MAG: JAB domain-containing protein [Flavobacteriales bacterium]|nr:JAB domain-containing protein [Flavobacteriales bacterium]